MKRFSVYIITCKVNNKRYVGMTSQEVRKRISNGNKYSGALGDDVKKYGWKAFSYEIVCADLDVNEAINLEREFIAKLDTTDPSKGYNRTTGGECRFFGHRQTDETRKKISASMSNVEFSDEHRKRISLSKSGTNHHFAKPVHQYSIAGEYIKTWDYMGEAAKTLGIAKTSISAVCLGKRKTAGGFKWSYSKDGANQC